MEQLSTSTLLYTVHFTNEKDYILHLYIYCVDCVMLGVLCRNENAVVVVALLYTSLHVYTYSVPQKRENVIYSILFPVYTNYIVPNKACI